jgi:DNA polymerase-1
MAHVPARVTLSNMKRVLLLDTYSLFFRAFHALPAMNTSSGQPTSAIYGLSVQLLQLLREQDPAGIGFALDSPQRSFRHVDYPDYKAQRPALPDPLRQQFGLLERWLDALGLPCYRAPGFEADDVLATLARELSAHDQAVRVVSGDRDLFQVATDNVDVLFVGRRGDKPVIYDRAAVEQRFGVRVEQLPALMALIGDRADNLPGVPGIGVRTAAKLVTRFENMQQLLEHLPEIRPDTQRQALADAREQLLRNETLARLRVDVSLPAGPRFLPVTAEALQRLRAVCVELEFKSLLPRIDRLSAPAKAQLMP